jgi:glutamate-5-semialdehyde dehydrogenase
MDPQPLDQLTPGMPIVFGGDRLTFVDDELAAAFAPGDELVVLQDDGSSSASRRRTARPPRAVDAAAAPSPGRWARSRGAARRLLRRVRPTARGRRHLRADRGRQRRGRRGRPRAWPLDDPAGAQRPDARRHGRRAAWLAVGPLAPRRGAAHGRHDGWRLEQVADRLGIVAFVFEGRPNVFADACGVLRGGNTVVFRIGSDALGTARAIVEHALDPALAEAGLPRRRGVARRRALARGRVGAVPRPDGWRSRSPAGPARPSGSSAPSPSRPASRCRSTAPGGVDGRGRDADREVAAQAVHRSLDRKVCNTLNVCCIVAGPGAELVPVFLEALDRAAADRGTNAKLHVVDRARAHVPAERFASVVPISRAEGPSTSPPPSRCSRPSSASSGSGRTAPRSPSSWWTRSPTPWTCSTGTARGSRCRWSPRTGGPRPRLADAEAPFVGNGFTRWVDGQYALGTPELGLSNWELGRLFGRSGILSGDAILTVRSRAVQTDPDLHR